MASRHWLATVAADASAAGSVAKLDLRVCPRRGLKRRLQGAEMIGTFASAMPHGATLMVV